MFFLHNLERRVTLHPSYFGRNMHELVTTKLLKDVEGTCAGNYYIISIMDTFDISAGKILPGNGLAEFTVGYRAVVWRPFKGETVDAVVYSVNPHGFFAQAGPLRLFVSSHVRGALCTFPYLFLPLLLRMAHRLTLLGDPRPCQVRPERDATTVYRQ